MVVTDGESHDSAIKDKVIAECEKKGITRFGIAVSDDLRSPSYLQGNSCGFNIFYIQLTVIEMADYFACYLFIYLFLQ